MPQKGSEMVEDLVLIRWAVDGELRFRVYGELANKGDSFFGRMLSKLGTSVPSKECSPRP